MTTNTYIDREIDLILKQKCMILFYIKYIIVVIYVVVMLYNSSDIMEEVILQSEVVYVSYAITRLRAVISSH